MLVVVRMTVFVGMLVEMRVVRAVSMRMVVFVRMRMRVEIGMVVRMLDAKKNASRGLPEPL